MAFLNEQLKLAYYPIPKVACSTLKGVMYELETGHKWKRTPELAARGIRTLHQYHISKRFDPSDMDNPAQYWKFAVLRDPASRIMSAYASKILKKNSVAAEREKQSKNSGKGLWSSLGKRLRRAGDDLAKLPTHPSPDEFVYRLDEYRKHVNVIKTHTRPTRYYLGTDLGFFDRLFKLSEMDALRDELSRRAGREVAIKKKNAIPDEHKVGIDDLSKPAFDHLMARLDDEYTLLADHFPRPVQSR
ncbi:sulfotransferase family 2 domain-containing protein [Sulfitobacter sp. D35]|uniref:sulfotransferase family 2 domain-containing protein n=1 Tax=Sulfitobacter sp. D35 TaxID=3083252 RepID=UPI00296FC327|nr:sulfotransferase family 2 domain-containing protein [Sulfitobacter sp. D35]MDW4499058.1 sulfotransferase family 2 domain-containing protein [Sulfitobacter sp. D35]